VHVARLPSPAGICDAARWFEYVNPSGEQRIGQDLPSLLGQRDGDVIPPAVTDGYLPALERSAQTGGAQEARNRRMLRRVELQCVVGVVDRAAQHGERRCQSAELRYRQHPQERLEIELAQQCPLRLYGTDHRLALLGLSGAHEGGLALVLRAAETLRSSRP